MYIICCTALNFGGLAFGKIHEKLCLYNQWQNLRSCSFWFGWKMNQRGNDAIHITPTWWNEVCVFFFSNSPKPKWVTKAGNCIYLTSQKNVLSDWMGNEWLGSKMPSVHAGICIGVCLITAGRFNSQGIHCASDSLCEGYRVADILWNYHPAKKNKPRGPVMILLLLLVTIQGVSRVGIMVCHTSIGPVCSPGLTI